MPADEEPAYDTRTDAQRGSEQTNRTGQNQAPHVGWPQAGSFPMPGSVPPPVYRPSPAHDQAAASRGPWQPDPAQDQATASRGERQPDPAYDQATASRGARQPDPAYGAAVAPDPDRTGRSAEASRVGPPAGQAGFPPPGHAQDPGRPENANFPQAPTFVDPASSKATPQANGEAWPEICERFALQMIAHAEQLRPSLDELEADEDDEERLQWLYQVDHSVTRMRRAARDLRILAGIEVGDLGGFTSSLVDVIRAAESAIEHYPRVTIGRMAELAVVPYAADDMASLLAALLDNATNYSPSTVTVSGHLLESGGVMLRVEDTGIGIPASQLKILNGALAGPVPKVNGRTGKHTGFPVVHRLAYRHGVTVRLASRAHTGTGAPSGTVAMVTIPPDLLCEVPDHEPPITAPAEQGAHRHTRSHEAPKMPAPTHLSVARPPAEEKAEGEREPSGGLPRRTRTSLRGGEGKPANGRDRTRDPAAVARSFAEDVSAFTSGQQAPSADPNEPEGRTQ